ncbi:FlgO family outer membrane protein, partial [Bowmanella dokdonensis]
EQGDLVLSRDYTELRPDMQANLVLTGTLTKHRRGVLVQARMVDLVSKELKASAQTLLPSAQVSALIASESRLDMPASGIQ